MAVHHEIKFAPVDEFYLDAKNPRLGREVTQSEPSQAEVLELMKDWTLDELATSYLESGGFWPQEAVIVVEEEIGGEVRSVVVEGNRRIAALMLLKQTVDGDPPSRRWSELMADAEIPDDLFEQVPYIMADERSDVEAFLGFRHVTGIKQWKPAEKAEFIARLIDDRGLTYTEAMRTIGSKTEPVRRNYLSYRILLQLDDLEDEEVSVSAVEDKFSVLFLSLRESGVQRFLEIDIRAEPEDAKFPVPEDKLGHLAEFAIWLFGNQERPPLVTDSRYVGRFARVLDSDEALEYLRSDSDPDFEVAVRKAGADEPELLDRLLRATDEIEQSLSIVHLHTESEDVKKRLWRLAKGARELVARFPEIFAEVFSESDT